MVIRGTPADGAAAVLPGLGQVSRGGEETVVRAILLGVDDARGLDPRQET